jgi:hypothetical protein
VFYTNHLFTDGFEDETEDSTFVVSPLYDHDKATPQYGHIDADVDLHNSEDATIMTEQQTPRTAFASAASLYMPLSARVHAPQQTSRPPSRLGTPRSIAEQ